MYPAGGDEHAALRNDRIVAMSLNYAVIAINITTITPTTIVLTQYD